MDILKEIYHVLPMELWMVLISMAVMGTWIVIVLVIVFFIDWGERNEDVGERNKSDKKI